MKAGVYLPGDGQCDPASLTMALAKGATLSEVNAAIQAGSLSNRNGRVLAEPLSEALLTDDRKVLYPVANGIPVLLEGEAISMEQLG